jgi:hypothetical protein
MGISYFNAELRRKFEKSGLNQRKFAARISFEPRRRRAQKSRLPEGKRRFDYRDM